MKHLTIPASFLILIIVAILLPPSPSFFSGAVVGALAFAFAAWVSVFVVERRMRKMIERQRRLVDEILPDKEDQVN